MYIVTINNNILHDPRIKDYQVLNPVLSLEINKAHSFNFTIYPNNPMFNSIERLKSIIEVYDDGELIFRGRPLNDTADFNKATTIQCEGELAYLNDSTMEPYSYFGPLRGLLELYIENHNAQVDVSKQFTLGTVNVTGDFVRSNIDYTNTWEEISTKTFGSGMGGYLRLRRDNDINYIDYLNDSPYISGQTIELSKNLLDYEKTVNASDIVTVLIPLGAKLKDEEGNETDERLTIESVNNGSKFIEHTSGISKYGRIVGYKVWDDINSPSLLKTRADNDLNFLVNLGISIKIKAVDLNILDKSIPKIRFFEYVKIISKPHEIDDSMLIKKQTIHLDDPSQNTIEVGVEVSSFTDKQLEANNTIKKINADYITNAQLGKVVSPILIQVSEISQEANLIKIAVSEIKQEMPDENLIVGLNGEFDMRGWTFEDDGYLTFGDRTRFFEGMKWNSTFTPVAVESLSGIGLKFASVGSALSPFARVFPDVKHSYRVKRISGSQRFTVSLLEYNSSNILINTTNYEMNENNSIEEFTQELDSLTTSVRLKFTTYDRNPLILSDAMFNRGEPKNWSPSVGNIREYSISSIEVLKDSVTLNSRKIDNATLKLSAEEGVEIWSTNGKGLTIRDSNNEATVSMNTDGTITTKRMVANDAVVNGHIEAVTGKIAGFDVTGNELKGQDVSLLPNEITIGKAGFVNTNETSTIGLKGVALRIGEKYESVSGVRGIQWSVGGVSEGFVTRFNSGVVIATIDQITPKNSGFNFGDSDKRYGTIYLQNQPNVSSDIRYKSNIQDIDNDLLDAFEEVMPKLFNTESDNNLHFGYIAQDVERALYKYCLKKYGYEFANEKVKQFAVLSKSESYLSLLYGELTVIKDAYYHREVERLKHQNQELQSELQAIKQFIGMGENNA